MPRLLEHYSRGESLAAPKSLHFHLTFPLDQIIGRKVCWISMHADQMVDLDFPTLIARISVGFHGE